MRSQAYAVGIEAGYDVMALIPKARESKEHLYLFGRYEAYNPYASATKNTHYDYTEVKRMAVGVNYMPVKEIVIKAEYTQRFLKSGYNNEPALNFSVAYAGFFSR